MRPFSYSIQPVPEAKKALKCAIFRWAWCNSTEFLRAP
jgi:hypothetical protein